MPRWLALSEQMIYYGTTTENAALRIMRDVSGMDRYSKFEKQISTEIQGMTKTHYPAFDMRAARWRAATQRQLFAKRGDLPASRISAGSHASVPRYGGSRE